MRLLQTTLIAIITSSLVTTNSDSLAAAKPVKASSSHRGHKSHGHKATAGPGDVWERIRHGLRIPVPSPASAQTYPPPATIGKTRTSTTSLEPIKTAQIDHLPAEESARLTTVIGSKRLFKKESQLPEKLQIRQELNPYGIHSNIDSAVIDKYTRLKRLKFNSKPGTPSATDAPSDQAKASPDEKLSSSTGDTLFKSSSVQRIRTRLGLHPGLMKHDDNTASTKDGAVTTSKKAGISSATKALQTATIRGCSDLHKKELIHLAREGVLSESYANMAEQCRIKQNTIYARVNKHIAGYSRGFLYQSSERARPYLYHIVDALSKYGLPLDLALLPIVESGYQPTALSPKSAAGVWQFIPSTGQEFGLDQNDDYDARLDVTASTHAAIRFLSGLKDHFRGDWLLALAAYNSGQGTVDAAIARNQAEGLDTDFWSLDLPAETEEYVPRLLALSSIFANPGQYGLKLRPVRNEPYFIKVHIDREIDINHLAQKDLKTVAKLANFDHEEFGFLNSAYLNSTITGKKPFSLLMPISNANQLHKSLAFLAQSANETQKPLPVYSESTLASEFSMPNILAPLLTINLDKGLQDQSPSTLFASSAIKLKPVGNDKTTAKTSDENYWSIHYLDRGESLKTIADYHGISEAQLREVNKFKHRQTIPVGQRLLIPLKQIVSASANKSNPSVLFRKSL